MITVRIVYAQDMEHVLDETLEVAPNSTIEEVLLNSSFVQKYPKDCLSKFTIGIFGKVVTLSTIAQPFDRIEIYTPLQIDPKDKRRERAKRQHFERLKNKSHLQKQ